MDSIVSDLYEYNHVVQDLGMTECARLAGVQWPAAYNGEVREEPYK